MIILIQPLAAGNALRIALAPPVGAGVVRLLRKDADTFIGEADPGAVIVHEGTERAITDFSGLLNGVAVWYKPYYRVGAAWVTAPSVSAVPAAGFVDLSIDTLSFIRERLEFGLKSFVDNQTIQHVRGYVPVLKASPQAEDVPMPLVTIHLQNESAEIRAIGEESGVPMFDEDNAEWHSVEGGFDRVEITIGIWSLNSDERITMRRALRAILNANLPVFDAAGMLLCQWSMQDMEDYTTYSSPVFQTICSFSCLAPAAISDTELPIIDVLAFATAL